MAFAPEQTAQIIVTTITGVFGLAGIYIANRNKKETKALTKVLNNSDTPIKTLDQALIAMDRTMRESEERHRATLKAQEDRYKSEIKFLSDDIEELRDEVEWCRQFHNHGAQYLQYKAKKKQDKDEKDSQKA